MSKGQSKTGGSSNADPGCGHDLTAQTLAKFIGDALIQRNPKMYSERIVPDLGSAIEEALKNMPNGYFCCSSKGETRRLGTGNKCNGAPCGALDYPYVRLVSKHISFADDGDDDKSPEVTVKKRGSEKKTTKDPG
ncbi:MAG: hypothetical protein ACF8PN_15355 [Phycisphaerales bacterium]